MELVSGFGGEREAQHLDLEPGRWSTAPAPRH
jgi:hypothetical protein